MKTSFQREDCPENQLLENSTGFSVPDKGQGMGGGRAGGEVRLCKLFCSQCKTFASGGITSI